jgi:hypothetical protein
MTFIVDTNVAIVANENPSEGRSLDCIDACIRRLEAIQESGRIAMDDEDRILEEYEPYMEWHDQRRTGHEFFIWVLDNLWNEERCDRVPFAPYPDDQALAAFDLSDRKFVRVALGHPDRPAILNAVDTDWRDFETSFSAHGIRIEFLCPEHA